MVATRPLPPLIFVLPEGSDAPSGGNVYDRELTRALAGRAPVEVATLPEAKRAIASGRSALFFFDTLDLPELGWLPTPAREQVFGLIVHHLPSLEPGAAPTTEELAHETARLSSFDLLVATSAFTRELLVARRLSARAILTVPPGLASIASPPRAYRAPLSALLVANVIPRKGVLPLLEALAELAREDARFSLRIVGRNDMDPDYVDDCRRAVDASKILSETVRFDGPLPYERMGAVYDEAALLVSASSMETFGMAIREARAHGLPIAALDGGYVRRQFTDGDDGVLCSSVAELARAVVGLARDEGRMSALFARAQATRGAPGESWADAARRFLEELERAVFSMS